MKEKRCELKKCNKVLTQRKDEPNTHFKNRSHCNLSCANTAKRIKDWDLSPKFCPNCDKRLVKKEYENNSQFDSREFCDKSCASSHRIAVTNGKKVMPITNQQRAIQSFLY